MLKQFIKFTLLITFALALSACGKKAQQEEAGSFETLNKNTPEYAAMRFMQSIYQESDIQVAVDLSTEKLARILQSYHTNRNVQRHLLNLKYDEVTIIPEEGGRVGRTEFAETATITIFFSGTYNGDKQEDLRAVDLIKTNGQWKVDGIQADPFL